jgi:DNA topoisomerase I
LEETLIRVGNEEYSRDNQSFGLTTLRDRHARIRGSEVQFRFRGKSGKEHSISLRDARLAKIVKRCRDLPGDELFQYLDDEGHQHSVDSSDVNAYLRAITSDDFSAKDFRTWAGTLSTAVLLHEIGPESSERAAKRRLNEVISRTAERLGNTPSVCRKCYVHPLIVEAYLTGQVVPRIAAAAGKVEAKLRADERAVVAFLKRLIASGDKEKQKKKGTLTQLLGRSLKQARGK